MQALLLAPLHPLLMWPEQADSLPCPFLLKVGLMHVPLLCSCSADGMVLFCEANGTVPGT